jgi:hypothetical protein
MGTTLGRLLSSKGRALARAFETDTPCRTPANRVTIQICKRYQSIVERRLDMHYSSDNVSSNLASGAFCHNLKPQ